MFQFLRSGLAWGLMIVFGAIAGCGPGSGKSADLKRQVQLEQILLDVQALRERHASNEEWNAREIAAQAEFPKSAVDELQRQANRDHPHKQLHLWCIRDWMGKIFRKSRLVASDEEKVFENNLRESAKLLSFATKLPPLPEIISSEDSHPDEAPDRSRVKPATNATRPIPRRPEGPLFYPGASEIPDYIPRMKAVPAVKDGESRELVLRLSQVEYLQGHWYGWVSKLMQYQNRTAPLKVSDDPFAALLESAEADQITWNLYSNSNDAAFQMGVEHGQRDCRRLILEYQQEFGFDLAKHECARSLESLYLPGMDGSAPPNGLIDPRALPTLKKADGKVDSPTDPDEPVFEPKP
jgi:hypothetical protein